MFSCLDSTERCDLDTRADLLRRIALAAPGARVHGNRLEIVLSGVAESFGADLAEEVRGRVPKVSPGVFNCSTVALMNLCDVAGSAVERRTGRPYAEVIEQLGMFTARAYFHSELGHGLWRMAPSDPHGVLARSLVSMRSVYTHGQRRLEKLGPGEARLFFREELMGPAWTSGLYRAADSLLPLRLRFFVENVSAWGLSFSLRFSW